MQLQDYFDGHIKGSKQVPSGKFKDTDEIDKVINEIPPGIDTIIVHCQLSQIRGPKCAGR
jgi:rhodanese-related sulfurtransferase